MCARFAVVVVAGIEIRRFRRELACAGIDHLVRRQAGVADLLAGNGGDALVGKTEPLAAQVQLVGQVALGQQRLVIGKILELMDKEEVDLRDGMDLLG